MSVQQSVTQDPEDYVAAPTLMGDLHESELEPTDVSTIIEEGEVTTVEPENDRATIEGEIDWLFPIEDHAREVELVVNPFQDQPEVVFLNEQES